MISRYISIKLISYGGKLYLPWEIEYWKDIDDGENFRVKETHDWLPSNNWVDGIYDLKKHKVIYPEKIIKIPSKTKSEFVEAEEVLVEVKGKYGYFVLDKIKVIEQITDHIHIIDKKTFNEYYKHLLNDKVVEESLTDLIEIHEHKWVYHLKSGRIISHSHELKRLLK